MEAETIEQWAAKVAPTLRADDWKWINETRSWHTTEHGAALLAHRDVVVAGLTANQREWLALLTAEGNREEWRAGHRRVLTNLRTKSLVCGGTREWEATPFGHEVARVLEVSHA